MTTALLRDARIVYENAPAPVNARWAADGVTVIPIGGRLSLGRDVPKGNSTLQVSVGVRDARQRSAARQWVDFEVR